MQKMRNLEPLDTYGWLSGQPADFRHWANSVGRWKRYRPGQIVYSAGDKSDGAYGLAEGGLQIMFPLVADEPVVVHRAEVGFWIGDAAGLSAEPRLVTVMAAVETRLLHLPSSAINVLLANRPDHWRCFYQLSMGNLRLAVTHLAEALALTVRARTCRRLIGIADSNGDAAITQDELAKLLGVTRPTIRRCLQELEDIGAIETNYRKLRIVNRSALEAFTNEQ
jgi:CRP/FNR family cyclic AMP-dependent transcriptional regulator